MGLGNALGGIASIGGAILGAKNAKDATSDNKDIAKQNLNFQKENAQANRDFAMEILNMSKPDLTSDELTALLLSQGEGEANKQRDRGLQQVMRQYTRAGTPSSGQDVIARTIAEMAASQGDRGIDARLRGTLGVLPSAAGLQIGGALYNNPAPQNQYVASPDMTTPLAIAGIGNLLPDLWSALSNTGVGDQRTT